MYSVLIASLYHIMRPNGRLNLTNMSLVQEEHTHPGLTYAAADRIWQFAVQKCLLERQVGVILAAADLELTAECILIYPDTHG